MKLTSRTYLCLDCKEIYPYDVTIYSRYPICPCCGSKNILNLESARNREEETCVITPNGSGERKFGKVLPPSTILKEGKDEAHTGGSTTGNIVCADLKFVSVGASIVKGGVANNGVEEGCDANRIAGSGREDIKSSGDVQQTDRDFKSLHYLINVLGILIQSQSSIKQRLQGTDANPISDLRGESEYFNWDEHFGR